MSVVRQMTSRGKSTKAEAEEEAHENGAVLLVSSDSTVLCGGADRNIVCIFGEPIQGKTLASFLRREHREIVCRCLGTASTTGQGRYMGVLDVRTCTGAKIEEITVLPCPPLGGIEAFTLILGSSPWSPRKTALSGKWQPAVPLLDETKRVRTNQRVGSKLQPDASRCAAIPGSVEEAEEECNLALGRDSSLCYSEGSSAEEAHSELLRAGSKLPDGFHGVGPAVAEDCGSSLDPLGADFPLDMEALLHEDPDDKDVSRAEAEAQTDLSDLNAQVKFAPMGKPPLAPKRVESSDPTFSSEEDIAAAASRRAAMQRLCGGARFTLGDVWTILAQDAARAETWLLRLHIRGEICTDNDGNQHVLEPLSPGRLASGDKVMLAGGLLYREGEHILHWSCDGDCVTLARGDGGIPLGKPVPKVLITQRAIKDNADSDSGQEDNGVCSLGAERPDPREPPVSFLASLRARFGMGRF